MKILISAGHSNTQEGAVSDGLRESAICAELRNLIVNRLKTLSPEAKIITDGVGAQNYSLAEVLRLIRKERPDVAVEIHLNASEKKGVSGVECISLNTPKRVALSKKLAKSIASVLEIKLRRAEGWMDQADSKRGSLGFVNAGGVIIELCFITSPEDMAKLHTRKDLVADIVARVLLNHVNN